MKSNYAKTDQKDITSSDFYKNHVENRFLFIQFALATALTAFGFLILIACC